MTVLAWHLITSTRAGLVDQHGPESEFVQEFDQAVTDFSHLTPAGQHAALNAVIDVHPQLWGALAGVAEGRAMPYGWWLDLATPMAKALRG